MGKNDFFEWRDTSRKIAMSEKVGKLLKFMQETACVHVEERELIAWCEAYPLICPEDKDLIKFLKEVSIPVFRKIGRGKWYRDTITDLGFALSAKQRESQDEDTSQALEE